MLLKSGKLAKLILNLDTKMLPVLYHTLKCDHGLQAGSNYSKVAISATAVKC
jgi:hypothetical protein